MRVVKPTVFLAFIIGMTACIDETIQLNKFSDDFVLQRKMAIPLIKASFSFEDIAGRGYDSLMFINEDTVWLYLPFDLELDDTFKVSLDQEDLQVDYLHLHYKLKNMFPVGLDVYFFLYDSVQGGNIDTIFFNENHEGSFIVPAPKDENGLTITEAVTTDSSFIALDEQLMDRMFNEATHFIIFAKVPATTGFIRILKNYRLDLRFGVDAKARYSISNDDSN
jgi:hypothetical protein